MPLDEPMPPLPSVEEMRFQSVYGVLQDIHDAINRANAFLDFIARSLTEELPPSDTTSGSGN